MHAYIRGDAAQVADAGAAEDVVAEYFGSTLDEDAETFTGF